MGYKNFAIDIAKQAGEIIKTQFAFGMAKQYKELDHSPVTETDLQINSLVVKAIKENFSDHDIVGEEESDNSKKSDYIWYCDPIDGTIPFSNGIPICTFSLALVYKGQPILGVVYEPFMDNTYVAEKNKGAFRNKQPIHVSKNPDIKGQIIALEHWSAAKFDFSKMYGALEKDLIKTLKFCSFIYKSVLVANGELIGSIFPHNTAHDLAAIKIIIEEAGGKTTDLYGNEIDFNKEINGFVASNGLVHDYILKKIKENVKL